MVWVKRQFNNQSNIHTHKQSRTRNSFTTSHRWQVFSHPQDSRAPSHNCFGRQMSSLWTPSPSHCCFSPLVYTLSTMPYGLEYPLGQLGSVSQLCPFPTPCAAQPTHWWGWARGKKGFDCVSVFSAITKKKHPSVITTVLITNPNSPKLATVKKKNLCPNPNQDILFHLKRELRICTKLTNKTVNCQEWC